MIVARVRLPPFSAGALIHSRSRSRSFPATTSPQAPSPSGASPPISAVFIADDNTDVPGYFSSKGLDLWHQVHPVRDEDGRYHFHGFHSVHLGDRLGKNGRYKVIHKLGNNPQAVIRLCRDTDVGLKILRADPRTSESSRELQSHLSGLDSILRDKDESLRASRGLPLDYFRIEGPKGNHLCFTYPVLGSKALFGTSVLPDDPDPTSRRISLAVVRAVGFLHSQGHCHGGNTRNDSNPPINGC